jgi:hypothetical protein
MPGFQSIESIVYNGYSYYKKIILNWQVPMAGSGSGGRFASRGSSKGENAIEQERFAAATENL